MMREKNKKWHQTKWGDNLITIGFMLVGLALVGLLIATAIGLIP